MQLAHETTPGDVPAVRLSVVVAAFNIARELPRTLRSLSLPYQVGVSADDYEIIVVDNGSDPPVSPSVFDRLEGQFQLLRVDDASPSPAAALNFGLRHARGELIGVMIDGARLTTPGLLRFALAANHVHPRSAIATLGWYLGFDHQRNLIARGWTTADEDRLLEAIEWPADGYRLFEIATMDESSEDGWLRGIGESNALFLSASTWHELGGYDERFDAPGGGLVNFDILRRASELDGIERVVLLGEATFHQLHGGVATNASPARIRELLQEWGAQSLETTGRRPARLEDWVLFGTLPESLRPRFAHALNQRAPEHARSESPALSAHPPQFHLDSGRACEAAGLLEPAAAHYREALVHHPGRIEAHFGLSRVTMPGPRYDEVLRRVHEELTPVTYLEIGVGNGASLALARRPTVAVGVDPAATLAWPLAVECQLFFETSSEFFEHRDVRELFDGRAPVLAFIDGLHQLPTVLEDFWHVEAISDPDTVIVLHDTIPLDEETQRPDPVHAFYTGDVWKLLHCLTEVRPDLSIFTVRASPSGLTFVTGLDNTSTVLRDHYAELVDRYGNLPYEDPHVTPGVVLDSDWLLICEQLRRRRAEVRRSLAAGSIRGFPIAHGGLRKQLHAAESIVAATNSRYAAAVAALNATRAELDQLQHTRAVRWSRLPREISRRVRRQRPRPDEEPQDQ